MKDRKWITYGRCHGKEDPYRTLPYARIVPRPGSGASASLKRCGIPGDLRSEPSPESPLQKQRSLYIPYPDGGRGVALYLEIPRCAAGDSRAIPYPWKGLQNRRHILYNFYTSIYVLHAGQTHSCKHSLKAGMLNFPGAVLCRGR